MLPDTITELDLFAPMPGPEELLFGPTAGLGQDVTMADWGTSQILPASFDERPQNNTTLQLEDDDLGLVLGEDIATPAPQDRSIEVGRRAETARPDMGESVLFEDDLGLDIGLDDPTIGRESTIIPQMDDDILPPVDDDLPMGGFDDLDPINISNMSALARADEERQRARESLSPLSDLDPEAERELERTFQLQQAEDEDDATQVQAQQRPKRRKVLQNDVNTELHNSQIRAQQEDRSKILKAPTFLPRDPMLLALMNMQKSGGFVSNILGNGRSMGWAPELRGVLSLEVVRRAGELKRKRDSGVAELEIPSEEDERSIAGAGAEPTSAPEDIEDPEHPTMGGAADDFGPIFPASDAPAPALEDLPPLDFEQPQEELEEEDQEVASPSGPAFDETTIPLVHPSDSGPVSLGTKHAVHLLREHFNPSTPNEPPSPTTRSTQSVLFTDLCPEARTSRQDATKLFFETLVLGTKDAIKVEQSSDVLGGPIRIRGKRGLWGDWAEMGVATQSQVTSQGGAVLAAGGGEEEA